MSCLLQPQQHFDYLHDCDDECKNIIIPYLNDIQRILLAQHNNIIYSEIPFVIQSICASYYCHHMEYRLSFKSLFAQFPTYTHFLSSYHNPHCKYNFQSCEAIKRIKYILHSFDSYLNSNLWAKQALSPYITYKYYDIKQILIDINHIHQIHPENMIKFYLKHNHNNDCHNACLHIHSNQHNNDCNDMEQCLKYNILDIHNEFIHHNAMKQQFEACISHIITYNDNVLALLNTLRNVCKKINNFHDKYRVLDTTNPLVQQKLMGYDGILLFLSLLGFESNMMATKLVCKYPPSLNVIQDVISIINAYKPINVRPINIMPPVIPVHVLSNLINDSDNNNNPQHQHERKEPVMVSMMDTMMSVNPLSLSEQQIYANIHTRDRERAFIKLRLSETDFIEIRAQIANDLDDAFTDQKYGIFTWFGNKFKNIKGK